MGMEENVLNFCCTGSQPPSTGFMMTSSYRQSVQVSYGDDLQQFNLDVFEDQ